MESTDICLNKPLSNDYAGPCVHSAAHILFPKNLPVKITVSGMRTIVHVGEFAVIPPYCVFEINSSPERYCIDFNFEMIEKNPEFTVLLPMILNPCIFHPVNSEQEAFMGHTDWYARSAETPDRKDFQQYFPNMHAFDISPAIIIKEAVSALAAEDMHFKNTFAFSKIFELYSVLGDEIHARGFAGKHETAAAPNIIKNLSESISFIVKSESFEISLEDAANAAGYSRTHYSKLFKDFYKISFYDFLLASKVRKAAKLLCNTALHISDTGVRSGFSSSSTYNRVFKQETGYSPSDFRKIIHSQI